MGAPADPAANAGGLAGRLQSLRWKFHPDQVFSGVMVVLMAYAVYESSSFSFMGKWFPMGLSILGLALSSMQFLREGFGAKTGAIMDIGIRSEGVAGARSAGIIFLVLLSTMLIIAGLFQDGLKWGALFIATIGPPAMMWNRPPQWNIVSIINSNRTGVIGGSIAGVLILTLNMLFFDYLLAVFWPKAFILDWFGLKSIMELFGG